MTRQRECPIAGNHGRHDFQQAGICWCEEETTRERASRIWNKRLHAIATTPLVVPPIKAYHHTPQTQRDLHEAAGNKHAAEFAAIAARDGATYKAFRKACARALATTLARPGVDHA